ncbi:site-specific DNA-methyltransferase [Helicobacter bilis]|uniref:site-specific DNA-methyltransferase n=2 Tax=Bacteria TaxID=2 RepID=UPI0026F2F9A5|nr:site-specific DNA-methyltransferase [Helicobacter bilis]MCI7411700.1 site-specific DNA-methyltransferase [Helicobacter bilis]MDD7296332.1 site-specific DNA-methyltransferase [Helicobacter bilis]MDY4400556.1 site-specific DNA-methyltransferase [Helicobacter bilis]
MKNELLQDLENRFETLNHIRNLAQSYDEKLFCYLLDQSTYKDEFKNRFFIMRNNTYIFKLNDFLTFLDLRNLSGSFTSYTNKIGLGFKTKSFLKTNNEVVLNFAYKDGVLKGGQSKDEKQKTKEIFFNEILAKDEIDVLFARKALQNFELIGHSACGDFSGNAADASLRRMSNTPHSLTLHNPKNSLTILECQDSKQDSSTQNERDNDKLKNSLKAGANLLIKGNNLLCLHSLKKKFANKIKLIYIDPPYNTGNDSFNYNDNFNHSTWLTFMKNRLEIAREFLRDDGVIFIQCDDNEQAYLKVLMDEIFGRDNFVGCCPVIVNRGGRDYGGIAKTHDYLLIYGKTLLTELYQIEDKDKKFQFSDENGGFNLMELRNRNIRFNKENRPNLYYPFYINPNNADENELLEISLESKNNFIELYPLKSQDIDTVWRWGKEKAEKFLNTQIKGKRKQDGGFMIVQKNRLSLKRQRSIWDNREFVNERGTEHIKQMLGRDSFSYPKSEFLLQRIIEISTNENDLVMDFFAGSGTTLAVAMKMKRQFIGIEQMDYIESITKERLKKVVSGEQGGISKAVDWQGGGSFIYAELMPLNAIYKERIKNINDEKMLDSIYKDLESKAFLDYRIDLDSILKDKEFKELDLKNKKEVLLNILDSNMDYVLYGDIEDEDYAISDETIELNRIFYGDCHDFANAKSRNDKKGK